MERAELARLEKLWLVYVETQHGAAGRRLEERAMVSDSQITLEPNYVHSLDDASSGS
jgi:hypothetical protein